MKPPVDPKIVASISCILTACTLMTRSRTTFGVGFPNCAPAACYCCTMWKFETNSRSGVFGRSSRPSFPHSRFGIIQDSAYFESQGLPPMVKICFRNCCKPMKAGGKCVARIMRIARHGWPSIKNLRAHVNEIGPSHFIEHERGRYSQEGCFLRQEKNRDTIRIANTNLAVHGQEGKIAKAITYYQDEHSRWQMRLRDGKSAIQRRPC